MEKLNNKETINLLDLSDIESDISDLIFTPKKKKVKRKHRPNGAVKVKQDSSFICKRNRIKIVTLWLAAILMVIWLVILSWLAVVLYGELRRLQVSVKTVIAGSETVPDALQTCHTLDKNFKSNMSHINDEIDKLNKTIDSFAIKINSLQLELQQVQGSLKSAPELTSVPKTVKDLQNRIGSWALELDDLQRTTKMLKDNTSALVHNQEEQRNNLSKVQSKLDSLSNTTQQSQTTPNNETLVETKKLWDAILGLSKNLTRINETLTMNITWALEDFAKDHKSVVGLQDSALNASSQISTLQQECVKKKDQEILINLVNSVSDRVQKIENTRSNQERMIDQNQRDALSPFENAKMQTTSSTYKASTVQETLPISSTTTAEQLTNAN